MAQTLEQRRAADAWERSQNCTSEYQNQAKGLPALIMNSGLMQVLAFLNEKGIRSEHCRLLGGHLRKWLQQQFPLLLPSDNFAPFMKSLMDLKEPRDYQHITTEAFAWLRWLRQMAPVARER